MNKYIVPISLDSVRLDIALTRLISNSSRSQVQKAIKHARVYVNNVIIFDSAILVKENDVITMILQEPTPSTMVAANISLQIIYEDRDLIVINKPAGMTVHPGNGNHQDTLANALLYHTNYLSDIGGETRPGIVHRLDKDTSGLIVVAKNNFVHRHLASQIASRQLTRKYKALVWGVISPGEGIVKNQIGRNHVDRKKMAVVKHGGKEAITYYKTEKSFFNSMISMVECKLETGRTHQIRVQLSSLGHSIVGDQVYGHNSRKVYHCPTLLQDKLVNFKRQALHSWYIGFTHPITGQYLEFTTQLPHDIVEIIQ